MLRLLLACCFILAVTADDYDTFTEMRYNSKTCDGPSWVSFGYLTKPDECYGSMEYEVDQCPDTVVFKEFRTDDCSDLNPDVRNLSTSECHVDESSGQSGNLLCGPPDFSEVGLRIIYFPNQTSCDKPIEAQYYSKEMLPEGKCAVTPTYNAMWYLRRPGNKISVRAGCKDTDRCVGSSCVVDLTMVEGSCVPAPRESGMDGMVQVIGPPRTSEIPKKK